jgi:hypothetical protein
MRDITRFGAFILAYEVYAKLTGHRTWTKMSADHAVRSIPVWVFVIWLPLHLLKAVLSGHD